MPLGSGGLGMSRTCVRPSPGSPGPPRDGRLSGPPGRGCGGLRLGGASPYGYGVNDGCGYPGGAKNAVVGCGYTAACRLASAGEDTCPSRGVNVGRGPLRVPSPRGPPARGAASPRGPSPRRASSRRASSRRLSPRRPSARRPSARCQPSRLSSSRLSSSGLSPVRPPRRPPWCPRWPSPSRRGVNLGPVACPASGGISRPGGGGTGDCCAYGCVDNGGVGPEGDADGDGGPYPGSPCAYCSPCGVSP